MMKFQLHTTYILLTRSQPNVLTLLTEQSLKLSIGVGLRRLSEHLQHLENQFTLAEQH